MFGLQRDSFLNTQVINASTKGGDGSAIRKRMKLMKQQLCFKITAKLGNPKRQHCSRQEYIYIYIYEYMCMCKVGTTVQKAHERKEDGKTERAEKDFFFF